MGFLHHSAGVDVYRTIHYWPVGRKYPIIMESTVDATNRKNTFSEEEIRRFYRDVEKIRAQDNVDLCDELLYEYIHECPKWFQLFFWRHMEIQRRKTEIIMGK